MSNTIVKCGTDHVGEYTWWESDARGIPLCKVCDECVDDRLSQYRPDVLTDSNYWADEPIEAEDY
jgi:hypothetical protein